MPQIQTREEMLEAMQAQEAATQLAAKESEGRKQMLKSNLQTQPGGDADAGGDADPELEGPDQAAHTMSRAESMTCVFHHHFSHRTTLLLNIAHRFPERLNLCGTQRLPAPFN